MTREANAGGRKATGNAAAQPPPAARCITGRIRGCCLGPERGADAGQVSLWRSLMKTPEPMDMLDAPASVGVNRPEDPASFWFVIDWDQVEDEVRRLRQRIFAASRDGDLKRLRNLQRLMLRSRRACPSAR